MRFQLEAIVLVTKLVNAMDASSDLQQQNGVEKGCGVLPYHMGVLLSAGQTCLAGLLYHFCQVFFLCNLSHYSEKNVHIV